MKVNKTFRFSEEAAAVLASKPNATQFLEDIILDKAGTPATIEQIKDLLESQGLFKTSTEPKYVAPRPEHKFETTEEAPKLNILDNDGLKALLASRGAKPIEVAPAHVCKQTCKHWIWDTDKGGRINTYTGEFEEGEPF